MGFRKSIAAKESDKRIERAYHATCHGIAIDIMDISKVFAEGRRLIGEGATDAELGEGLRAFVETIRADGKGAL